MTTVTGATCEGSASVVFDSRLTEYSFGPSHPMSPIRVDLTMRLAEELGVLDRLRVIPAPIADQDAIATAGRMSIQANNTTNFAMNEHSYISSKGALSRKMSAFRRSSQGDTDAATAHAAAAPLESLREEEERKDDQ